MEDTKAVISEILPDIELSEQFKTNKDAEALFHAYNTLAARSGRLSLVQESSKGSDLIKLYNELYEEDKTKVCRYYKKENNDLNNPSETDSFSLFLKKMAVVLVFFVFAVLVLAFAYNIVVAKSDPNVEIFKTFFDALTTIVKVFFGI